MKEYVFEEREYDYVFQPENKSYVIALKDNADTLNCAFLASNESTLDVIQASLSFEPIKNNFRYCTMISSS